MVLTGKRPWNIIFILVWFSSDNNLFIVLENAEDEISWRQGEFIFDDLPLQEIARELSNTFGATIQIADTTLQNYRITARFRDGEDLATILSVLHNAGYFNYSQNNKQIIITAKPN